MAHAASARPTKVAHPKPNPNPNPNPNPHPNPNPNSPEVCALLHPCERLHTVRLTGCYRLTTAALTALCEARGAGLRSLTVTGNSQLGPPAI